MDVRELGAAFLGGTSLIDRCTAGLVTELTPGAVSRASLALGPVGRAPHSSIVF